MHDAPLPIKCQTFHAMEHNVKTSKCCNLRPNLWSTFEPAPQHNTLSHTTPFSLIPDPNPHSHSCIIPAHYLHTPPHTSLPPSGTNTQAQSRITPWCCKACLKQTQHVSTSTYITLLLLLTTTAQTHQCMSKNVRCIEGVWLDETSCMQSIVDMHRAVLTASTPLCLDITEVPDNPTYSCAPADLRMRSNV